MDVMDSPQKDMAKKDQPESKQPESKQPEGPQAEKRKGVSLVERAAAQTQAEAPKRRGIGRAREAEAGTRDPSAMTPLEDQAPKSDQTSGAETEKPRRRGIGHAGARGQGRTQRDVIADEARAKADRKDALADKLLAREGVRKKASPANGEAGQKALGVLDAPKGDPKPHKPPRPAMVREEEAPAGVVAPAQNQGDRKHEVIDLIALRDAGYITPDMPPNLMAEEFRIIKRSLVLNAFAKGDDKIKNGNVLLVTSSNPGEGKSFCAINLALSIATEQDTTVLLVDADFSKPEVLNRLGVSGGKGLMDVVADKSIDLAGCLVRTNIPNLVLLPAGRQHNLTTELLASERMQDLVCEISTRYPDRIVIFDSPPVLASSAASVMALYMGQTVFVIEAERTTQPQIEESLNLISGCDHVSLLLNKTKYGGSNKKFATYYGYGGR